MDHAHLAINCLQCKDSDTCSICHSGYLLHNGQCKPCSDENCEVCDVSGNECFECNDTKTCVVCASGWTLTNGICVVIAHPPSYHIG